MKKTIRLTETELTNLIKKVVLEQAGPIGRHDMGPMWWQEMGCIVDGVDGLNKVQTGGGSAFEHTQTKTILYNPYSTSPKANEELVNKVKTAYPKVKMVGRTYNYATREEGVFFCKGPHRGGLTMVGMNDTVEPPKAAAPKPSTTPAAPVNERTNSKNVIRITEADIRNLIKKVIQEQR